MTKQNRQKPNHILRTLVIAILAIVGGSIYYSYIAMQYAAQEPQNPIGKNIAHYEKHKYTYDIFALPSRMTYYLLRPQPFYSDVQYPLLVVLHGGTGKAYAAGFMAEEEYKQKYPGYVLVPVAPVNHIWHDPYSSRPPYKNALPYVVEVIKHLTATLPVDKGRVYAVGCSMGGGGSIVSSLYYQDTFAAAYAAGSYFIPKFLPKKYDTPLVVFHGVQDDDAPVELIRQTVSTLKKAGAPVQYKEFRQYGHNCPAKFFYPDVMWDWLYSQSKPRLR